MSIHQHLHVSHSQISVLSKALEDLKKANQHILNEISKQRLDAGNGDENVKRAKEILINLQALEKRDEDRERALEILQKKINLLHEKVETLTSQNGQSAKHVTKKSGQMRYKQISNYDFGIAPERTSESVDAKSSQDSENVSHLRTWSKSEETLCKDIVENVKDYDFIKIQQFLTATLKKDNIGFKFKETDRSVDNRVRLLYREKCVHGELIKDSRSQHLAPKIINNPTENNLSILKEFQPMKENIGCESKMRSELKQQDHSRSKGDFETLDLMRSPGEIPRIRDLNSWRHIAEEEKNRGLFMDVPTDETGLDTCLLLDLSASMQGETFDEMIRMAKHYVRGIEEVATSLPVFIENIGIATFGHYIGVVQHMTNDYKKIQDILDMLTPGGSSPMSAGLYMGLACCLGNKKSLSIPKMFCKMIMFTDGKATSDVHIQMDADDPLSNSTETLKISMALHETSCDIGRRDIRVYCYAIGCENDMHLKTITENTEGKIYRGDDINKLIRMTQTANIALGVKDNIPDLQNLDDSAMREVCQALHVGLLDSNRDMDEVIHLIKFYRNRTKGTNQDDSRYLEMNDPVLPPLGTRVRRGPDWSWGYQDSDGPGTIVGHSPGHLWVEWDSGHINVYKCNPIFGFDVMTVHEPRILRADELIAVGCLVQRGADWRFDDQDGGEGNVGVVIKVDKNATVVVRWPNKQKVVYKYGNDGFFEIKLCDPSKVYGRQGNLKINTSGSGQQATKVTMQTNTSIKAKKKQPSTTEKSNSISLVSKDDMTKSIRKVTVTTDVSWSYKKDDTWYVYPDNVNTKIEKAFQRNSQLCIVELHGDIFQISFKKMVQICNKTGQVTQVKRDVTSQT